ncbi:uncharacterized protein LOC128681485 [Plodia interpunctella]|uniref:uncharacterized protein LOC128681485 n=1 Tax=Plodia interpunctella TaxID=58824 RepID=UPI002368C7F9|nr:uncharacterized protein LOC128681485 [Plodia interpunctella]
MFAKAAVVLCLQVAFFNVAYNQVINRIPLAELQNLIANNVIPIGASVAATPCGNIVPVGPQIVPVGPQIVPAGPQIVPFGPQIVPIGPNVVEPVLSAPVTVPATTTIIQDSSVANNLANALQLLVVSNLLSTTLPTSAPPVEVVSPLALNGQLGQLGYSILY